MQSCVECIREVKRTGKYRDCPIFMQLNETDKDTFFSASTGLPGSQPEEATDINKDESSQFNLNLKHENKKI